MLRNAEGGRIWAQVGEISAAFEVLAGLWRPSFGPNVYDLANARGSNEIDNFADNCAQPQEVSRRQYTFGGGES